MEIKHCDKWWYVMKNGQVEVGFTTKKKCLEYIKMWGLTKPHKYDIIQVQKERN